LEHNIFKETTSGTSATRPKLKACLDYLREGDTLVVTRLDRLAHSTLHLCQMAPTILQLRGKSAWQQAKNITEDHPKTLRNRPMQTHPIPIG
jgi:DNA invertase Pin-like site-specific DNA recombinase